MSAQVSMGERDPSGKKALAGLWAGLEDLNRARERGEVEDDRSVERMYDYPSTRLAVYGSLAPDEVNHHVIETVAGSWEGGFVRGELRMKGWGRHVGFPGLTWLPTSDERVPVRLFTSSELPAEWSRIDEFEGRDYVRILVLVEGVRDDPVVANLYQIRAQPV